MPFNLKEYSFPIVPHCHLCHKSSYHVCIGQFLDSLFCSTSLFVTISHCISCPSFKRVLISGKESLPTSTSSSSWFFLALCIFIYSLESVSLDTEGRKGTRVGHFRILNKSEVLFKNNLNKRNDQLPVLVLMESTL